MTMYDNDDDDDDDDDDNDSNFQLKFQQALGKSGYKKRQSHYY